MRRLLTSLLIAIGATLLGQGLYMDAKAGLAQVLIASSWQQRAENRPPPKPWWWADTRAIAKLEAPKLEKSLFVMQDSSGESLAFGPGHLPASAKVSSAGHVMIAGHRDSHFAFLKDLKVDDEITTTSFNDLEKRYKIVDARVMNTRHESLQLEDQQLLTLITCYPFDSVVPGGPLRYVVTAEAL